MSRTTSLYLHFPYCWSKCSYCAFNSVAYSKPQSLRFLEALKSEIQRYACSPDFESRSLSTIYMGGGTPSIFSEDQILDVLAKCRAFFLWEDNIEITLEANPGTIHPRKLAGLRGGGINRLSIGIESFQDAELKFLGRAHNAKVAREALPMARAAGFENISLDFIYALPDQTMEDWKRTLDEAIQLNPEHLSAYALMIEEGTELGEKHDRGLCVLPDEERQIRFDRWTRERFARAGFHRYEVSNYSKSGSLCRHNMVYWSQGEYLGLGPGAHSYFGGQRFSKTPDVESYIQEIEAGGQAIERVEVISRTRALQEAWIFGLRTTEGIDAEALRKRYPEVRWDVPAKMLQRWINDGLAVPDSHRVRLSEEGLEVWDLIAADIVAVV